MWLNRESHDGFQHSNFTLFELLSLKESLGLIVCSMDHWLIMAIAAMLGLNMLPDANAITFVR